MEVRAPVIDGTRTVIGFVVFSQLPARSDSLVMRREIAEVAEGGTYHYRVALDEAPTSVELEPGGELFSYDSLTGLAGRFQPRQHVGRLRIEVRALPSGRRGTLEVDVTPMKLEYASEYHRMLSEIADIASEALLQGFAPAALTLVPDPRERTRLAYQQFAFLSARLESRELRDALALIVANPHRAWESQSEMQSASRPLPGSSELGRAVARPGRRVLTHGRLRVASVPRDIERRRTDTTFDSVPNRFVKHALQRWRAIAQALVDHVDEAGDVGPGPVRRGLRAAQAAQEQIDQVLAAPLFAQISPLGVFPSMNQVLHKQQGYREVFRTFALTEVGAKLRLDLDVDVFAASQRNVATLYEYWAFLQLVEAIGAACGERRTVDALCASSDGLTLGFKQGAGSVLRWDTAARGRRLDVEVFFNRHFRSTKENAPATSWSRAMRPDCSVLIRPKTDLPHLPRGSLDVWLHFDAKYRLERDREQFDPNADDADAPAVVAEQEAAERLTRSRREDLLKMHAYRDAIRGSAGAYVLFPGDRTAAPFREFAEPLPGLGAFALRPTDGGIAHGRSELQAFVREALDHVADRATQDERYRYWREMVRGHRERVTAGRRLPPLAEPPRDAAVLCCIFATEDERNWTARTGMYALPAGNASGGMVVAGPELVASWAVFELPHAPAELWRRDGAWFVETQSELEAAQYPVARDDAYLCASFLRVREQPEWLAAISVEAMRHGLQPPSQQYFAATWADLVEMSLGY